jgi:hypothetical protein
MRVKIGSRYTSGSNWGYMNRFPKEHHLGRQGRRWENDIKTDLKARI